MEVNSRELEIEVLILEEEFEKLTNKEKIESILKLRSENFPKIKQIPFSLVYIPGPSEQIEVKQYPDNVYMGNAEKIEVSIQDYLYQKLKERGYCGDRFYKSGKVEIFRICKPETERPLVRFF